MPLACGYTVDPPGGSKPLQGWPSKGLAAPSLGRPGGRLEHRTAIKVASTPGDTVDPPGGSKPLQDWPSKGLATPSLGRPGGRLEKRTAIPGSSRGFSLIELLVVVAMIAIAAATVSLSLRDPAAAQLEREAERLVALFETARAESRAAGLNVQWTPVELAGSADQFRFVGLPTRIQLPRRWLGEAVNVEIANAHSVRLGPEPMIGAQQLRLRLGSQQLTLSTDGLAPFEISHSNNAP